MPQLTGAGAAAADAGAACRFCLCDSSEQLISPCGCRGTSAFVHLGCLRRWQLELVQDDLAERGVLSRTALRRASTCSVCQQRLFLDGAPLRLGADVPAEATQLLPGTLLVSTRRFSKQSWFRGSVVLLCHTERSGRRLGVDLTKLSQVTRFQGVELRTYKGGPVGDGRLLGLSRAVLLGTQPEPGRDEALFEAQGASETMVFAPKPWRELNTDEAAEMVQEAIRRAVRRAEEATTAYLLLFHGLSAWRKGQLEMEMSRGFWEVCDAEASDILGTPAGELHRSLLASGRPRRDRRSPTPGCTCTLS